MILDYETYAAMGGDAYDGDGYEEAETRAEVLMRDLTLGRLDEVDWSGWRAEVYHCMRIVIDALPQLDAAYAADVSGTSSLSSFSNGVDSFSFASSDAASEAETLLGVLWRRLQLILPVELCSTCVGWNHAH